VEYRVPDFADEKSMPQQPKPLNAWVLDYQFDKDTDDRVVDSSGKANDGAAQGAKLVDVEGRRGREFSGRGQINVKNAPSLDPSVGPWTVEATFRAEAADAMILARGGQSNGYALYLVEGRPTFTYTTPDGRRTIAGNESLPGRRAVVTARVTATKRLQLWVDGQQVAQIRLDAFIANDPNDNMQIGADRGSPVLEAPVPAFRGVIERVRLFSGEAPAD
jgi:concanavalin A-like lectin/glucanase superfamily protein